MNRTLIKQSYINMCQSFALFNFLMYEFEDVTWHLVTHRADCHMPLSNSMMIMISSEGAKSSQAWHLPRVKQVR